MSALRDFVDKFLETNRIGFGDLRRLQRDVLPQRITTTDEAELLLAIDGALVRADRDWTDYLADAVGEFTLWGMGQAGRITQAKAEWLLAALATARSKTASAVLRKLAAQAPQIDPEAHIAGRAAARSRADAGTPSSRRQGVRKPACTTEHGPVCVAPWAPWGAPGYQVAYRCG